MFVNWELEKNASRDEIHSHELFNGKSKENCLIEMRKIYPNELFNNLDFIPDPQFFKIFHLLLDSIIKNDEELDVEELMCSLMEYSSFLTLRSTKYSSEVHSKLNVIEEMVNAGSFKNNWSVKRSGNLKNQWFKFQKEMRLWKSY